MAGVKHSWKGVFERIRDRLVHRYEGNTCTGADSKVSIMVRVSEGRDKGRLIEILLSPEDAKFYAESLSEAAKKARSSDFYTPASN